MGFSGISIWQLLIILAIVVLLFGTKRLRSIGTDLGGAIKGFKKSMTDDDKEKMEDENKNIDNQTEQKDPSTNVQREKTEQK